MLKKQQKIPTFHAITLDRFDLQKIKNMFWNQKRKISNLY